MVGPLHRILTPFQQFVRSEATGGILLMATAIVAFAWANSPWHLAYEHMRELHFGFSLGDSSFDKSLEHWVNDGLMAVFFLLVGLEIKREILVGELSNARKATLAVCAAIGGMVVPALIFVAFNMNGDGLRGWGIPMATDIAFALGVLSLLGRRVPLGLKVLLAALAIVDDLGAVLVIAVFYTEKLDVTALMTSFAFLAVAFVCGRAGMRRLAIYGLLGVGVWFFMLKSGVHATIAGVLLAMTVPIKDPASDRIRDVLGQLTDRNSLELEAAQISRLQQVASQCQSPLHRMEHKLHPWSAYLVMPVFALFNAGLHLGEGVHFGGPITLGASLGLFVGKPLGIVLASWLAVKLGIAVLPNRVGWGQMVGLGFLGGIGFTMSLFIAALAYPGSELLDQAKIGVLATSVAAGIVGAWLVRANSVEMDLDETAA